MENEINKENEGNYKLAIYWDDQGQKIEVTVNQVKDWLADFPNSKKKLANFVYQRLYTRYLKPFTFGDKESCTIFKREYKNGFSMMANYCLLIEALQSFKKGLKDSKRNSKKLFQDFFQQNENLSQFQSIDFYHNVRCGILHQGETTGGIKITRKGKQLWDANTKTIDAVLFGEEMGKILCKYKEELEAAPPNSKIWGKCKNKIKFIISNCKEKQNNN